MQIGNYIPKPSNTGTNWIPTGKTIYNIEISETSPAITVFGIDTESGDRAKTNLLRDPVELVVELADGAVVRSSRLNCAPVLEGNTAAYSFTMPHLAGYMGLVWRIGFCGDRLEMSVAFSNPPAYLGTVHDYKVLTKTFSRIFIHFPFSPFAMGTNILSEYWGEGGSVCSPLIINALDMGQLALAGGDGAVLSCRFTGSRAIRETDFYIDIAEDNAESSEKKLIFSPVYLEKPSEAIPAEEWIRVRRGLLSLIQCTAYCPTACGQTGSPGGILGNNVISDPVSCGMSRNLRWLAGMGENASAGGVDLRAVARYTIEYWANNCLNADGGIDYVLSRGYTGADGGVGVLNAAGDYFNSTGDIGFVRRNRDVFLRAANYYITRDFCGDGLFISHKDGNDDRKFGDTGYDTISSGYKNAVVNVNVYKAFLDVAYMMEAIDETDLAVFYRMRAKKLRQSFNRQFYDRETGLYYWWIGKNGVKHQYMCTVLQSQAVIYGIADFLEEDANIQANGLTIMQTLWRELCQAEYYDSKKKKTVKYINPENGDYLGFYWGIPGNLRPVPPDYNYSDFGRYEFPYYCNGCIFPQDTTDTIQALRAVGMTGESDLIKTQIYKRQHEGIFENGSGFYMGVVHEFGTCYSILKWDGTPTCYEGIISRDCAFLENTLWYNKEAYARLTVKT